MPRKKESDIKNSLQNEIAPFLKLLGTEKSLITKEESISILKAGSESLLSDLKTNATLLSNTLGASIKVYAAKKGYKIYLGPDYRKSVGGGQLGHLFEYGTAQRERRSISEDGKVTIVSTGMMPARPWMRPAWDANKSETSKECETGFIKLMENKLKKVNK
jgi:hypothetical protein